jgi:hypothetical protein
VRDAIRRQPVSQRHQPPRRSSRTPRDAVRAAPPASETRTQAVT